MPMFFSYGNNHRDKTPPPILTSQAIEGPCAAICRSRIMCDRNMLRMNACESFACRDESPRRTFFVSDMMHKAMIKSLAWAWAAQQSHRMILFVVVPNAGR